MVQTNFRVTVLLAALLGATIPSIAQDELILNRASECSSIEDSLRRLTCFDQVFPADSSPVDTAVGAESVNTTDASNWEIEESQSALDDSPKVVATLLPTQGAQRSFMGGPALVLRCIENTTSVVLFTGQFMIGDSASVTYRIGSDAAVTQQWNGSSNRQAVGLWSGSQAIPFIKALMDGERLVMRVEARERTDAEFEVGNVSVVRDKIAAACNWPD